MASGLKSFSDSNILVRNYLFLKNYVTSEGVVFHQCLYDRDWLLAVWHSYPLVGVCKRSSLGGKIIKTNRQSNKCFLRLSLPVGLSSLSLRRPWSHSSSLLLLSTSSQRFPLSPPDAQSAPRCFSGRLAAPQASQNKEETSSRVTTFSKLQASLVVTLIIIGNKNLGVMPTADFIYCKVFWETFHFNVMWLCIRKISVFMPQKLYLGSINESTFLKLFILI